MTNPKSLPALGIALACLAITFSLAVRAQAQTFSNLTIFDGTNGNQFGALHATFPF
jgi:hypothetical protein